MSVIQLAPVTIVGRRKITKSYAKYSAELDSTICDRYNNADLTLRMNLGFRQINPPAGAATGTHNDYGRATGTARNIIRWTPGAWSRWMTNFVQSAQRFWNGKFWLVNNFPTCLEYDDDGTVYRHNIYCKFRLTGADASSGGTFHHTIDVVRLDPAESFFGSHARLYDTNDTQPTRKGTDSAGNAVMQRAHVHEVGHLLGLGHAVQGSTVCPEGPGNNTNAPICYGTSDHDMNNVMGSGMALYPEHAFPWRRTIADMTSKGTVRSPAANRSLLAERTRVHGGPQQDPTSSDWAARLVRHYPRTLQEARLGQAITRRPRR